MINTLHKSSFYESMELFNEIEDFNQLLLRETTTNIDSSLEEYQDLQSKYNSLYETYAKEIANSKKVEKCLIKCMKFYSKLCKKYEAQQKIISNLEENIKEKVNALEESLKNQEKLKGVIQVYMSERTLYTGASSESLKKDKELLLDICCRLINESVKSDNVRDIASIIVKKFRKDLDEEKLKLLKPIKKENKLKEDVEDIKASHCLNSNLENKKFSQSEEFKSNSNAKEEKNSISNNTIGEKTEAEFLNETKLAHSEEKQTLEISKSTSNNVSVNNNVCGSKVLESASNFLKNLTPNSSNNKENEIISPKSRDEEKDKKLMPYCNNEILPPDSPLIGVISDHSDSEVENDHSESDSFKADCIQSINTKDNNVPNCTKNAESNKHLKENNFKIHKNKSVCKEIDCLNTTKPIQNNLEKDVINEKEINSQDQIVVDSCEKRNNFSEVKDSDFRNLPQLETSFQDTNTNENLQISSYRKNKEKSLNNECEYLNNSGVPELESENKKFSLAVNSSPKLQNFSKTFEKNKNISDTLDIKKEKHRKHLSSNILHKHEKLVSPCSDFGSIFDIPDGAKVGDTASFQVLESDVPNKVKPNVLNGRILNKLENSNHQEESLDLVFEFSEDDLCLQKIFREMSHVRLLSPIREISDSLGNEKAIKSHALSSPSYINNKYKNGSFCKRRKSSNFPEKLAISKDAENHILNSQNLNNKNENNSSCELAKSSNSVEVIPSRKATRSRMFNCPTYLKNKNENDSLQVLSKTSNSLEVLANAKSSKSHTLNSPPLSNKNENCSSYELTKSSNFLEMHANSKSSKNHTLSSPPCLNNKNQNSSFCEFTKRSNSVEVHTTNGKKDDSIRIGKKRNSDSSSSTFSESSCKSKKSKPDVSEKKEKNCGLLDSIMSAMSIQNEKFKTNATSKETKNNEELQMLESNIRNSREDIISEPLASPDVSRFLKSSPRKSPRNKKETCVKNLKENFINQQATKTNKGKQVMLERHVLTEIKKFVSSPMNSKEEADKHVKHCISALSNKPEETIARSIVAIVFENIDENVEIFERPAPPLTKTQHRLIVLLSVFKTVNSNAENIPLIILNIIWEKLFPDKFFWPDDCIETVCRFYAALCKTGNDTKSFWKFCLQAMTDMKQRSCLLVFTALKTWPDVLHDATTLQNNILAVTIVNIFLHMPKSDGLRNLNQKKKLLALKHLLMNFYQFKVDDTIENYCQKVFDAFLKEEKGSEKSLVLLTKCRDWTWTSKNILPKLKKILREWSESKVEDIVGIRILSVIKQICSIFPSEDSNSMAQVVELISCLSGLIISGKMSHTIETNIIELLLQMKYYAEARKVIREWVPKFSISESLRNEVINASAENILRELKLNRRKETSPKKTYNNFKKKSKNNKNKKKNAKKRKKSLKKE